MTRKGEMSFPCVPASTLLARDEKSVQNPNPKQPVSYPVFRDGHEIEPNRFTWTFVIISDSNLEEKKRIVV
jgi:hypothetical protein